MASVYPPVRADLQSTVAVILVIVLDKDTELNATVRCVKPVTWIIMKVRTGESMSSIIAKTEDVCV